MAKTIYTIASEIIKETEKAYLFEAGWNVWLPKSQISVWEYQTGSGASAGKSYLIELPTWLYIKNRNAFSLLEVDEANVSPYELTQIH